MTRLIDKDALIEILAVMQGRCNTKAELIHNSKIWQQVKDMPTVEAVPVRHGRWIAHTMSEITGYDPALSGDDPVCSYSCSVCGEDCYASDTGDDILSDYCPHCGADMRGEQDG